MYYEVCILDWLISANKDLGWISFGDWELDLASLGVKVLLLIIDDEDHYITAESVDWIDYAETCILFAEDGAIITIKPTH